MKYIYYTTEKSDWINQQVQIFATEISKTKGRGEVTIDIVHFPAPKTVPVMKDSDGDVRFTWDWFNTTFKHDGYDGVIFQFNRAQRRRWRMTASVNGCRNQGNRDVVQFWVCADIKQKAQNYDMSQLLRILYHEQSHFDEDVDDAVGNVLTQDSVHKMDYELHQIDKYHLLVDYRGQALKRQVNVIINNIIKLVKKYV